PVVGSQIDVFGRYTLKNLGLYSDVTYGIKNEREISTSLICTAVRKNYLFVLSRETYLDKTQYTLKRVSLEVPPNGENYLEVLADLKVDISFDKILGLNQFIEQISSMSFCEKDSKLIIFNTNLGRRFIFRMHFDYYFYDRNRGRVFTLEK